MMIDYSGRTKQRSNTRISPLLGTMFFASLSLSVLFDVFKMKIVFHIWDTLQKTLWRYRWIFWSFQNKISFLCRSCDEETESASSSKNQNIAEHFKRLYKELPHHIFIQNYTYICSKCSFEMFCEFFGKLLSKFLVAEAVMRKRNELEKMKMLRQDEERRREELVGGK